MYSVIKTTSLAAFSSAFLLAGCGSMVNTAGSDVYACPGMPMGVTCKTPAAVYKSTNRDIPETAFDAPIGEPVGASRASIAPPATVAGVPNAVVKTSRAGPKPVREPAKVVRIWVAPWIDDQDGLHLAQINYAEVTPRTWTVGKSASEKGSSYVIPHQAYQDIDPVIEPAASAARPPPVPSSAGNPPLNAGTLIQPQIEPVK